MSPQNGSHDEPLGRRKPPKWSPVLDKVAPRMRKVRTMARTSSPRKAKILPKGHHSKASLRPRSPRRAKQKNMKNTCFLKPVFWASAPIRMRFWQSGRSRTSVQMNGQAGPFAASWGTAVRVYSATRRPKQQPWKRYRGHNAIESCIRTHNSKPNVAFPSKQPRK
jgi:hypothetical protein